MKLGCQHSIKHLYWSESVQYCSVGKLVTDWYALRKVLKHLTVQSLVFPGTIAVKGIETVASSLGNRYRAKWRLLKNLCSCQSKVQTSWHTRAGRDCDCNWTSSMRTYDRVNYKLGTSNVKGGNLRDSLSGSRRPRGC